MAALLVCACSGDGGGAAGSAGMAADCGGCAIPVCGNPGPCDCGCFEGDTMNGGALVCTAEGCFAPTDASSAGAARATTPDSGGAASTASSGGGTLPTDAGITDGSVVDAAVDAAGASAGQPDAATDAGACAPVDVQSVRSEVDGCAFALNVVVRSGEHCQGQVTLDGGTLACDAPNGWRMPDMSTLELVGAACAALQASSTALVRASFPCQVIAEVL
jgi:hypothetical protein